jgi:hypothetical protein
MNLVIVIVVIDVDLTAAIRSEDLLRLLLLLLLLICIPSLRWVGSGNGQFVLVVQNDGTLVRLTPSLAVVSDAALAGDQTVTADFALSTRPAAQDFVMSSHSATGAFRLQLWRFLVQVR